MNRTIAKARRQAEKVVNHWAELNQGRGDPWIYQLIGQGDQAYLFRAQRGNVSEEGGSANRVVIKLYKHSSAQDHLAYLSEKRGLESLAEALDSREHEGWSLRSPDVYYAHEESLCLVMSELSGTSIEGWLTSTKLPVSIHASLVRAIVSALQSLWSRKLMYGDLNLKNILCDTNSLSIGFIDPGLPHELFRCQHVSREWYPASRDLAYLLYSVAVSVKNTLANPAARRRQFLFVNSILKQYVQLIESPTQRTQLLEEIRQCAQTHVDNIDCHLSPAGLWRRLVKQITQNCIDDALAQLALDREGVLW